MRKQLLHALLILGGVRIELAVGPFQIRLEKAKAAVTSGVAEDVAAYGLSDAEGAALHYLVWGRKGADVGIENFRTSLGRLQRNRAAVQDITEIIDWRRRVHPFPTQKIQLLYPCNLRLHAAYGYREITASFGKTTIESSGPTGVGVIHIEKLKTYLHFDRTPECEQG